MCKEIVTWMYYTKSNTIGLCVDPVSDLVKYIDSRRKKKHGKGFVCIKKKTKKQLNIHRDIFQRCGEEKSI